MGFKKREFTGKIKTAVVKVLKAEGPLSRRELLGRLRETPEVGVSGQNLTSSLGRLLKDGKVIMEGQRAKARFRRARKSA
jgi:hypothetical protein